MSQKGFSFSGTHWDGRKNERGFVMTRLEFLGHLARAKRATECAQKFIDNAIEMAVMDGCAIDRENIDLSVHVANAMVNIDQASLDFEALAKIFKRL